MRKGYPIPRRLIFFTFGLLLLLIVYNSYNSTLHSSTISDTARAAFYPSDTGHDQCIAGPVAAPKAPDRQTAAIWRKLQKLFDNHTPQPEEIKETGSVAEYPFNDLEAQWHDKAQNARQRHEQLLTQIPRPPKNAFSGRGIVMVTSKKEPEFAATSLGMLRILGSRLPIELWMLNKTTARPGWCEELAEQGVACRFLADYVRDGARFLQDETEHTALALLLSSFEEIMFLGAATMPVVNPDGVFESEAFQAIGSVLWPDFRESSESPWTDYIIGVKKEAINKTERTQTIDAGQMLWDKGRHWKALVVAAYYNYHGPSFFYPLLTQSIYGPAYEDTFPTALRAVSYPHFPIPHPAYQVRRNDASGKGTGPGVSVIHADPRNRAVFEPLFMHTSDQKFGVRDLMCDFECEAEPAHSKPTVRERLVGDKTRSVGSLYNHSDHLRTYLINRRRVLAWKPLHKMDIDPELHIWRVLERLACMSKAWGSQALCQNVAHYMRGAFEEEVYWRGDDVFGRMGRRLDDTCWGKYNSLASKIQ